jgi:hypothetical protein
MIRSGLITLCALGFFTGSAPAEAARTAKKLPVYPAIVSETRSSADRSDTSPLELRKQSRNAPVANKDNDDLDEPVVAESPNVITAPVAVSTTASHAAANVLSFDYVPEEHVDSVARRLAIVEKIIREHGRAYDYRAHTTHELLSILARLEQNHSKE